MVVVVVVVFRCDSQSVSDLLRDEDQEESKKSIFPSDAGTIKTSLNSVTQHCWYECCQLRPSSRLVYLLVSMLVLMLVSVVSDGSMQQHQLATNTAGVSAAVALD